MANKIKGKEFGCRHTNVNMMAENLAHVDQLKRVIRNVAVKIVEQIPELSRDLQQYFQDELSKAVDCLENVSHVLVAQRKGYNFTFNEDHQQSKDTSAYREDFCGLCCPSDGKDDLHTNDMEESFSSMNTPQLRSSKQYKVERKKQQLVQVAIEPTHLQTISKTTKLKSSETPQKATGGWRSTKQYQAERNKQQLVKVALEPTHLQPIFKSIKLKSSEILHDTTEGRSSQAVGLEGSNDLSVTGKPFAREATEERRCPEQNLEQNQMQLTYVPTVSQEEINARQRYLHSNHVLNDRADAWPRKLTDQRRCIMQNKIKSNSLPPAPRIEISETNWDPSDYRLPNKGAKLPSYSTNETKLIKMRQDHDMRQLFGL